MPCAETDKEFMHFKMAIEYAAYAFASKSRPKWDRGHKREEAAQVALARDIFGNPYRPVTFERAWRPRPPLPSPSRCTTRATLCDAHPGRCAPGRRLRERRYPRPLPWTWSARTWVLGGRSCSGEGVSWMLAG